MNTYLEERWSSVGLSFNPWEHSRAEQQGILLAIFKNLHVLTVLELTPSEMLDFCLDIEKLYKDVPYHSFNHAVDVVVKLYYVLHDLQASSYLASYDIAVLLISGLCHDAGHPGLNNLFQKNANTECAQKYPDAILERYSIDLAVEHVGKHRLFRNVENVRDPFIRSAILYTDMSRHFDVLEECKVLVSISMCDALLDSTQRQSLIGILLHAVDVFNPVLPWPMCKKWSDLMNTESFNQGDLEKKLSLPVSPNMDRETTDQRQVSLDFGNIIIRPFFLELVSLFPVEDALLPSLDRNLVKWSRLSSDS
ncbi:HD-domain/PDEase-like protein, partial [Martensiomyces pterosporus]